MLVLATGAASAGAGVLVACAADDSRPSFVAARDADVEPDVSSPPPSLPPSSPQADADVDAGLDAGPTKPDYDTSDETVVCTATPCVKQLAAGDNHFCALLDDGTVRCWGDNYKGALGSGNTARIYGAPQAVIGVEDVTQLRAQGLTTCARTSAGRVKCWGQNLQGQLGLQVTPPVSDSNYHATPSEVPLDASVERVDVSARAVCAVGSDGGDLYCWGGNDQKQLARVDAGSVGGPGPVDGQGYEVTRIAGGLASVFGMTKSGELVGWGAVSGRPSSLSPTSIMAPIPSLEGVTSLSSGTAHQCAIASGTVYCWGTNSRGLLGTGISDDEAYPAPAALAADAGVYPQQVAASPYRTCVRMTDGTVQCAGWDDKGQLGRGDAGTYALAFVPVSTLQDYVVQIATSYFATCALVQGGKVVCWGGNAGGELGMGTTDSTPHPSPVSIVFP
ncbi:hypothetical protein AKJ09_10946 [Labilithrix luteola]|uniref:BNR repeat domain protein n=1 Tax=Labilithrix luteola TaxID=1391654 RepID=A0A0K1QEY4_9BACT|nr:hypothetical protein AKJ09_10946 [Labilithrix luteola]